jgi:hypothetical protein
MTNQNYLLDDVELTRLDIEWLVYNAIREGAALSLGNLQLAGHRDSLRLAQRVAPSLFASSESLLVREWESPESREIRDIATATGVSFEIALNAEIERYDQLMKSNKNQRERLESLNRRLSKLRDLQSGMELHEYYEGKLIERDARIGGYLPKLSNDADGYLDFSLPADKVMRIRVTHETKIEGINGADLIYEHHDLKLNRVRIAAVQYKILKDERYTPKSKKLERQLTRLDKCFCQEIPCKDDKEEKAELAFRFPTCAAFLRPTYRLQNRQSSILSRGYYMSVCLVRELWKNKQEISEQSIDGQIIRQAVFDELFNANLLGSRWIDTKKLDEIYKAQGVLQSSETSVVHVKTYS